MTMYLSVLQSVSLLAHESWSDKVGANQSVAEQQNVILSNRLHQTALCTRSQRISSFT